jgi:hypothetical protein
MANFERTDADTNCVRKNAAEIFSIGLGGDQTQSKAIVDAPAPHILCEKKKDLH